MNELKNFVVASVLGAIALTSGGCARAELTGAVLPKMAAATREVGAITAHIGTITLAIGELATQIGATTAEVGRLIAADLGVQLRDSLQAPRAPRVRCSPAVFVSDSIETVVVTASRLPPQRNEHVQMAGTARVRL